MLEEELPALIDRDACQTVVIRFWNSLDRRDYAGLIRLFVPGGVWKRGKAELRAPDSMFAALQQRPATLAVRHIVSNLDIRLLPAESAEAEYYVTVYRHDDVANLPAPLRGPHGITQWNDRLVKSANGWRLSHKSGNRVFEAALG
jgi:hypothetical protein